MRKYTLLAISALLVYSLQAQIWEDNLLKSNSIPTVTEKFEAFQNYKKKHAYTKGNGYNPYAREMYFIKERLSNDNKFQPTSLYTEC